MLEVKTPLFQNYTVVLFCFFSVLLLSVLCFHSMFSSPPQRPINSYFSIPDFIHYINFPILIIEKETTE